MVNKKVQEKRLKDEMNMNMFNLGQYKQENKMKKSEETIAEIESKNTCPTTDSKTLSNIKYD